MSLMKLKEGPHGVHQLDYYKRNAASPIYVWWRAFSYDKDRVRIFISRVPYEGNDLDTVIADCLAPRAHVQEAAEWFADLIGAATGSEVINKGEKHEHKLQP